ncbi:PilW family protein [Methyloversatilis sp.]|uniref:PilW family protein n=1 Tax=Methyloversatilis sp. TaxID=2569862 RepID=UPI0027364357|nr:PilW family protein [Methyloversatilis sp.]MDP3454296.1 PilW family protein [Methyloversatilis sp.]MDP3579673.1 PilW family protein [Methyloversatilis sp.]
MNIFHSSQRGTSLVEVLVTLVLGLVVSAGAIAMVMSNREAYRSTEALSRIQESTRMAFELMSRDLRAVGINSCNGGRSRVVNLLKDPATKFWSDWSDTTRGLRGFDNTTASLAAVIGTGEGQRVSGTDLVEAIHGGTAAFSVSAHNDGASTITLATPHTLASGDLVVLCDFENSAIFQVSAVDVSTNSIVHDIGAGSPGNCSSGLAFRTPVACDGLAGVRKVFPPGSQLMRLQAAAWFVGNNGRGSNTNSPTSLYRVSVSNNAGSAEQEAQEIVEGVRDMQITYRLPGGDYLTATNITALNRWNEVVAIQIELVIDAPDTGTATNAAGARLTRRISHVVNLRNRVS